MNDGSADAPESSNAGRTERHKERHERWRWFLLVIPLAVALSYCGAFSPLLSPLVYPRLAPPDWRNITPHGNVSLDGYAVSPVTPGLVVACGTDFTFRLHDPATWLHEGRLRFWLSHDGGASWSLISMPKSGGSDCGVAIPSGESGVIIATVYSTIKSGDAMTDVTTWVSHDAGASWRTILTAAKGDNPISLFGALDDNEQEIYYRHGVLYGSWWQNNVKILAYSANDGASWKPIVGSPDALEQAGWQTTISPAPDYRGDRWWYRILTRQDQPPMLEHSSDDGRTWTTIGAIGTEPIQWLSLATSPLMPDHLCAAKLSSNAGQVSMFASADRGRTWRTGAMPAILTNITTGETSLRLQLGGDGTCYQGYHYHRVQEPSDENDYAFVCLAPDNSVLQVIPLGADQNVIADYTTYVPAGDDMQARLVTSPALITSGWSALTNLATETDRGQLLWTAVP